MTLRTLAGIHQKVGKDITFDEINFFVIREVNEWKIHCFNDFFEGLNFYFQSLAYTEGSTHI